MPSRSNISASGGAARDNNASANDAIKDEDNDDNDGPIPFLVAGVGGAPDGGGDCGRTVTRYLLLTLRPTNVKRTI